MSQSPPHRSPSSLATFPSSSQGCFLPENTKSAAMPRWWLESVLMPSALVIFGPGRVRLCA